MNGQGQLELGAVEPALRLFFALLPPARLRDEMIVASAASVRRSKGRPTPLQNLHVTLAFMGDTVPGRLPALKEAAGLVRTPAFALQLDRIDLWRNGILLLDTTAPPPALVQLVGSLQRALRSAGFPVEPRSFRLHLTLARDAMGPASAVALPLQLEVPLAWPVESFFLVHSRKGRGGSLYETIGEWPLG